MGDTDAPNSENENDSCQSTTCDIPKPSIDLLKAAKPSENIAISEPIAKSDNPPTVNAEETAVKQSKVTNAIVDCDKETLKTSCDIKTGTYEEESPKVIDELKNDKTITKSIKKEKDECLQLKDKVSLKNRSDIFSLNENKTVPCTIFSVGGAPSKTIHKTLSINSGKMSSSNETLGSTTKKSQFRNPLTGIGVSSNDEFKSKPIKRKDGNPLLGVGYKDDETFFNTPATRRIPPGGYSKGLW